MLSYIQGPWDFSPTSYRVDSPLKTTHHDFIAAFWKQAAWSLIHCVAGDATAIIGMVTLLHYFELSNGIEVIIEYIAAYLFDLMSFQALFMRSMFSNYWMAVRKMIFAGTISMNMVMTGMFPVIVAIKVSLSNFF